MSTPTKRPAPEQLVPEQAKKAKAEQKLGYIKAGLAEVVKNCTDILQQLQDDPDCFDDWMVGLAIKVIQYGKTEKLDVKLAEKKEEQVNYLRFMAQHMMKDDFGTYVRSTESMKRKYEDKEKQLDQAIKEQVRCINEKETIEKYTKR